MPHTLFPYVTANSRHTTAIRRSFSVLYLMTMMCMLLATSCEKPDMSTDQGGPDVEEPDGNSIRINITQIGGQATGTATGESSMKSLCTRVSYCVFEPDGKVYKTLHQTAADTHFGTVGLSLPAGRYHLVVIAHNGNGNASFESEEKIKFKDNKVTDTFGSRTELDITGNGKHDIQLERMVAKIRMELTGAMPAEARQMEFYYTGGSSTLSALSGFGSVNSRQTEYREVTAEMTGKATQFEIYTFPHEQDDAINLTVKALDAGKNTIQSKTFENVPIRRNGRTVFSDKFFEGGSGDSGDTSGDLTVGLTDSSDGEEITRCH